MNSEQVQDGFGASFLATLDRTSYGASSFTNFGANSAISAIFQCSWWWASCC